MAFPPGQEADDVDLQRALDAGRTWIDWFTGRTFGTRAPRGTRLPHLRRPPPRRRGAPGRPPVRCCPTVEVDTDGRPHLRHHPRALRSTSSSPYDGPPFDPLRAWAEPGRGRWTPVCFDPGQLVKVTGVWGYTDERGRCPAPVAQANLLLGARWFKRQGGALGGALQRRSWTPSRCCPGRTPTSLALLFPLCRPGSPGAAMLASQLAVPGPRTGRAWVMVLAPCP